MNWKPLACAGIGGVLSLIAYGCSTSSTPAQGGEGEACYASGTCNTGLSCVNNLCVAAGMDGGGGTDAGTDAGSGNDAGTDAGSGNDAGTDAGFTVAGLPGLALWLDAAKGVTGTSSVTAWADQSNNANNASPTGAPPDLVTGAINNLPAVHLVAQGMAIPDTASLGFGTGEFLVEVVARAASVHNFFFGTPSAQLLAAYTGGFEEADLWQNTQLYSEHGSTVVIDDTPHLIGMQRSGSGSSTTLDVRINGALDGTMTSIAYAVDLGSTAPGSIGSLDSVEHVAEVVVIKGPTSAGDLANLEAYLKTKYGL